MAFAHVPAMYTRYDMIDKNTDDLPDNPKKYADFLQQQTRKCKRDGYLDSDKYVNRFLAVEREKERQKASRETSTKPSEEIPALLKLPAVQKVQTEREKFEKEFEVRLSAIDMELWQSKKEQRQLRRFEGDFVKSKQQLREMLRKYQRDIETRQAEVDKVAEASTERFKQAWQEYAITSSMLSKSHIRNDAVRQKTNNLIDRKQQLKIEKLEHQYSLLKSKLCGRQEDSERMFREFERKLLLKENEQSELKRKLAELAISIHMESKKRKDILEHIVKDDKAMQRKKMADDDQVLGQLRENFGADSDKLKRSYWERRRLSDDGSSMRERIDERTRDEDRRLIDTQMAIKFNKQHQANLRQKESNSKLDRSNLESDLNVREAGERRQAILDMTLSNKQALASSTERLAVSKAELNLTDVEIVERADEVQHLGKIVEHDAAREAELWRAVRKYESQRNAASKDLQKLQERLLQLRTENHEKLRLDELSRKAEEQKLMKEIQRVQSELSTAQQIRESSYYALTSHRDTLNADRHEFSEKQKELNKLEKVKQLTSLPDSARL